MVKRPQHELWIFEHDNITSRTNVSAASCNLCSKALEISSYKTLEYWFGFSITCINNGCRRSVCSKVFISSWESPSDFHIVLGSARNNSISGNDPMSVVDAVLKSSKTSFLPIGFRARGLMETWRNPSSKNAKGNHHLELCKPQTYFSGQGIWKISLSPRTLPGDGNPLVDVPLKRSFSPQSNNKAQ